MTFKGEYILNSKLEKLLSFIIFCGFNYLLYIFASHFEELTFEHYKAILICSLLLMFAVRGIYFKCRNKHFANKINKLLFQKKYSEALILTENAIKGQPKLPLVKAYKAIVLAFSGAYEQFKLYKEEIPRNQKYLKKSYFYIIEVLSFTIDFIENKAEIQIAPEYINNKRWRKFVKGIYYALYTAISNYENRCFAEAIHLSNKLLFMSYEFLKFTGCTILVRSYEKLGDSEMADRYRKLLDKYQI